MKSKLNILIYEGNIINIFKMQYSIVRGDRLRVKSALEMGNIYSFGVVFFQIRIK